MEIKQPLCITSRLLPGVEIGGATISIEYAHVTLTGQQAYRWFIDNIECPVMQAGYYGVKQNYRQDFQGDDLRSGVGGGSLQEGLASLFSFLGAFAEAHAYQDRVGQECENADLFPHGLKEWAVANADEISMLVCELEENPGEYIIEN